MFCQLDQSKNNLKRSTTKQKIELFSLDKSKYKTIKLKI